MTIKTLGSSVVRLNAKGLPPYQRVYVYLNQFDLTTLVAPDGSSYNTSVITDSAGNLVADVYIPNNPYFYIPAGPVKVTLVDNDNWPETRSSFVADGYFEAISDSSTYLLDPNSRLQRVPNNITNFNYPLSQTFIIDGIKYPNGVFLTGIDLFFRTKSVDQPVLVELRQTIFGTPEISSFIGGSSVVLQASEVKIPASSTFTGLPSATRANFSFPVYISPGVTYALSILTNSSEYSLFTGKVNTKIAGATNNSIVTKEPYVGALFKPQILKQSKNSRQSKPIPWNGDPNHTLCFNLIKAKFETGSKIFTLRNKSLPSQSFDSIKIQTSAQSFNTTSTLQYALQTTNTSGTAGAYEDTIIQREVPLYSTKRANVAGDINLQVTYNNSSPDVSPILDLNKTYFNVTRYDIDPLTSQNTIRTAELLDKTSTAQARYLAKTVTLANGVRANGISIRMGVNRKIYTDIDVFVKIRSDKDRSKLNFSEMPWQRLSLLTGAKRYSNLDDDTFFEEVYEGLNLSYTGPVVDGVSTTFNDFNQYAIKVIFYSDNNSVVPKIRDIIATAVYA